MIFIEQNAKLKILRNLIFRDRCNLRTVNKDFNNIFKKYKHEKIVYGNYNKNINYSEYKNINFALNNFDKLLINVSNNVYIFNVKYKYINNLPKITELPSELCNVHTINLCDLSNLKKLPSELGNVHTLSLSYLPNLKELPSELGHVYTLKLYDLENLKELPSELDNVHTLVLNNLQNIKELPLELGNIHTLFVWDLPNLKKIPSELGNAHTLTLKKNTKNNRITIKIR